MGGRLLASGLGAGLLLLLLCGHGVRASRYVEDTDRFPGWKGALPMPGEKPAAAGKEAALSQDAKGVTLALGDAGSVSLAAPLLLSVPRVTGHALPLAGLERPVWQALLGCCMHWCTGVCLSTTTRTGGVARGDGGGVLEAASVPPQKLSD